MRGPGRLRNNPAMGSSVSSVSPWPAASGTAFSGSTGSARSASSIAVEITSVSLGSVSQSMVKAYPPFAVFRSMNVRDNTGGVASTLRWPIAEDVAPAARYDVASSLGVSGHQGTNRANVEAGSLQTLVERASRPLPPVQVQGSRTGPQRQG